MAELDKKILKAQTDLVQAVLEAQEKRNQERVDMLVTNAIKQLKMSRFKPDQTTCISLTYLARISPKVFIQSSAIKEVLKSSLRRETGPANIKGKNDILLPVLSANILLACCDATEIRLIILNKIEQWLASNQKVADIVQHLLSTICMKCQGDEKTIAMLIDMRQHWLQLLEGSVPPNLCVGIRKLLHTETSCSSLITYLKFLIKHDNDIEGLSGELARFVIERPMSLDSMLNEEESAMQLIQMILQVFIKLFTLLIDSGKSQSQKNSSFVSEIKVEKLEKVEKVEQVEKVEKVEQAEKAEKVAKVEKVEKLNDDTTATNDETTRPPLYIRLANSSQVIPLSWATTEAALTLMTSVETCEACKDEFNQLLDFWRMEDGSLSTPHNLPNRLRQKLLHSSNGCLIELGLQNADVSQLVELVQQFGMPLSTINKIFERLSRVKNAKLIESHVKDQSLFCQLLEFYDEMGAPGAKEFRCVEAGV